MKNRLEGELISIAHRILKLKNKSEVAQLHKETLQLYEKLSVLLFVEENYQDTYVEIPEDIEEKLENIFSEKEEKKSIEPTKQTEIVLQIEKNNSQNELFQGDTNIENEQKKVSFEDFEAQLSNAKSNKKSNITEVEIKETEENVEEEQNLEPEEQIRTDNISKTPKSDFDIRLNDRVAFEFHLFGGDIENFNRVISQLGTFETFEQAKDFIENVVKPDYSNWKNKEEYQNRFMEIIENRFL